MPFSEANIEAKENAELSEQDKKDIKIINNFLDKNKGEEFSNWAEILNSQGGEVSAAYTRVAKKINFILDTIIINENVQKSILIKNFIIKNLEKFNTEEKIKNYAKKNNIPIAVIKAYLYDDLDKNTWVVSNKASISWNKTYDIYTKNMSWDTEYTRQIKEIGEINPEYMTWLVLDFSWSMKKEHLQWMLSMLTSLYTKWIVDKNTKINVVNWVIDGDSYENVNKNISTISYWEDGKWLISYLKKKKLMNENGEIIKDWSWCTPLYNTILKNLQESTVKDVNIFTDGASDVSPVLAFWEEESWWPYMRDSMISVCKDYDKKINLIIFNLSDPKYKDRIQNMKNYFESTWNSEYLDLVFLESDNKLSGEDLSELLVWNILSRKKIQIISEVTNKQDIINLVDWRPTPGNNPYKLSISNPKQFAIDGGDIFYKENWDKFTYNVDLSKLFPGVDLSKYTINYTTTYTQSTEKGIDNDIRYDPNWEKISLFFDISGSMSSTKRAAFNQILLDPNIGFDELSSMFNIKSFWFHKNKLGKTKIKELSDWKIDKIKPLSTQNIDDMSIKEYETLYPILAKKFILDGGQPDQSTIEIKQDHKTGYPKYTRVGYSVGSKISSSIRKKEVVSLYSKLDEEAKKIVSNLYNHASELNENLISKWKTPFLDAIAKFWANDTEFLENYKDTTVIFVTDLWENASNWWMKEHFMAVSKGKKSKHNDKMKALQANLKEYNIKFEFRVPLNSVSDYSINKDNGSFLHNGNERTMSATKLNRYKTFVDSINDWFTDWNKNRVKISYFEKWTSPLFVQTITPTESKIKPSYMEIKLTPKNNATETQKSKVVAIKKVVD